jgi:hypothetical protein
MSKIKIGLWLMALALSAVEGALAQMPEKGLIIRVMDRLVYIDLGQQEGVQPGDLFDVVDDEVLAHPLTGDTLAVTPKSVGALRVLQVYPKMALAELMHLQGDKNPMLMKIAPIEDAERLMEIEQYAKMHGSMGGGAARGMAIIPGLYQYRTGARRKGLALLGLEATSLALGIGYRLSSDDWYDQYKQLPPGLAPDRYTFYFDEASQRRSWSNRFFWVAGALFTYNLVDAMWMGRETSPALSVGLSAEGRPLLRLVGSF